MSRESQCVAALCFVFLSTLTKLSPVKCQGAAAPEVDINSGRIRGQWEQTKNGVDYAAFTGVPYAKPPVRLVFKKNQIFV